MKLVAVCIAAACASAPTAAQAPKMPDVVTPLCSQYALQALALAQRPVGAARVKKALDANNLASQICNNSAIMTASKEMVMRLLIQRMKDLQATHWVGAKPQL